jgi:hypothetical protein
MGGHAIPQQGGLLPAEEPSQLTEDLDEALGVVVAGRVVEAELGAAAPSPQARRHRARISLAVPGRLMRSLGAEDRERQTASATGLDQGTRGGMRGREGPACRGPTVPGGAPLEQQTPGGR